MSRLTNEIVVITGGTSWIGLAAAKRFIKEGATVIVTGRSPQSVGDAQKELGANGLAIAADVTKSADLIALFQPVREKYGRIDVLYVHAGVAKLACVAETTEEVFDDILDVNFRGAYLTMALPLPNEGGAIVLTASRFAAGVARTAAVFASKAALRNFGTLASERMNRHIRINAVNTRVVETAVFSKLGLPEANVQKLGQAPLSQIPKRFGKPDEVAAAVAFPASDEASYITGVELPVDDRCTQL
jgi:NAD(P)-dependent dehydrogenase (short-subunit alcohol dehydrogenase family)